MSFVDQFTVGMDTEDRSVQTRHITDLVFFFRKDTTVILPYLIARFTVCLEGSDTVA